MQTRQSRANPIPHLMKLFNFVTPQLLKRLVLKTLFKKHDKSSQKLFRKNHVAVRKKCLKKKKLYI